MAGPDGTVAGRPGTSQIRSDDVMDAFATLPSGVRLRDDPAPVVAAPPPAAPPKPNKHKRRRRR